MQMKYYLERAGKNSLNESLLPQKEKSFVDIVMEFVDTIDMDGLSEQQIKMIDEMLFITEADDGSDAVDLIDEQQRKMVVRAGKRIRKMECPEGMKAVGGKCERMTSAEKRMRTKGAKMAAKKRKSQKAAIQRKRQKSLAKR